MSETMKKHAEYIKRKRMEESWREGTPINQSEFARRIGIAQGSLSQYENGTRLPTGENLQKLAAYFGVEYFDILGLPRSIPDDEFLHEVIDNWGYLPEAERKRIASLIKQEAENWKKRSRPNGF